MISCIGVDHLKKEKHCLETSAGTVILMFVILISCYDSLIFTFLSPFLQSQNTWSAVGRARQVC